MRGRAPIVMAKSTGNKHASYFFHALYVYTVITLAERSKTPLGEKGEEK